MMELPEGRCFVIAEAGTCHVDPDLSCRLRRAFDYVEAAKEAGAGAIKFQWFHNPTPDSMFCWIDGDEERARRWRESAMPMEAWAEVKEYAEDVGLVFLASAFEAETVRWLNELGVVASKVASRATRDFPYDEAPSPWLVSTGMYAAPDRDGVIALECQSRYPSDADWSGTLPGFSDHSGHPRRAIDAIRRGCRLLEVHFYHDPGHAGPDLPASLTPEELSEVCHARDIFGGT